MPKIIRISDEMYEALKQIQETLKRKQGTKISLKGIAEMAIYRYWKEVTKE